MWIYSKYGFYSIVLKDNEGWHVRARAKEDLDRIDLKPLESYQGSDYPWRAIVEKDKIDSLFKLLGDSIDYPNFKGQIGSDPEQTNRLGIYHDIHDRTCELEEIEQ
jgi:hypothetical protein